METRRNADVRGILGHALRLERAPAGCAKLGTESRSGKRSRTVADLSQTTFRQNGTSDSMHRSKIVVFNDVRPAGDDASSAALLRKYDGRRRLLPSVISHALRGKNFRTLSFR